MSERAQLEQQLLAKPFDVALRARYADLLADAGEHAASLEQWRLVVQQDAEHAEPHLRAALCCVALEDVSGAARHLAQARARPDFNAADPRVVLLEQRTEPQAVGGLRLVHGGRQEGSSGEVISISRADKVRFADIVGMEDLKQVVRMRIVEPFVRPGLFQRFKKRAGGGVLLYGPPGCGKTMMARAIASECEASFTAIGISDILNLWIGESERNLAATFDKARSEAPSVLFFDELDALAYSRSKASSDHTRTLVNEFLNQLDGMSGHNERVLVLAATNMPWDVDEAMKRPGRFDRQIFVPPPDAAARAEMFRAKLRDVPCAEIDHELLARRCESFSGADIDGVIEQAKDIALGEMLASGEERELTQRDLEAGLENSTPSTLDWLKTARNLVKFGGAGSSYKDVEKYLRAAKLY
jgi:transitional endoplasmic reticulum ATPase